jgi:hypothetical protein
VHHTKPTWRLAFYTCNKFLAQTWHIVIQKLPELKELDSYEQEICNRSFEFSFSAFTKLTLPSAAKINGASFCRGNPDKMTSCIYDELLILTETAGECRDIEHQWPTIAERKLPHIS